MSGDNKQQPLFPLIISRTPTTAIMCIGTHAVMASVMRKQAARAAEGSNAMGASSERLILCGIQSPMKTIGESCLCVPAIRIFSIPHSFFLPLLASTLFAKDEIYDTFSHVYFIFSNRTFCFFFVIPPIYHSRKVISR